MVLVTLPRQCHCSLSQVGVIAVTSVIQLTIHHLIAHVYSHVQVKILRIVALMLLSYAKT
jgi:hypothetical protein